LSEEEGEKEPINDIAASSTFPTDVAASYFPVAPEVEETTIVEKILAMRTKQVRGKIVGY